MEIRVVYEANRRVYGYRRVYMALVAQQVARSRNRLARQMRWFPLHLDLKLIAGLPFFSRILQPVFTRTVF